jgi:hypothetical protein
MQLQQGSCTWYKHVACHRVCLLYMWEALLCNTSALQHALLHAICPTRITALLYNKLTAVAAAAAAAAALKLPPRCHARLRPDCGLTISSTVCTTQPLTLISTI